MQPSRRGSPRAPPTLHQRNQPWLRVVDADWEVLWWQAEGDPVSRDDISTLPSVMEDFDRPTPLTVRRLQVAWPTGRSLHVVCLVSVEDDGSLHHHATGFGLSADAALAALAELESAIFGRLDHTRATIHTVHDLLEAFDAA